MRRLAVFGLLLASCALVHERASDGGDREADGSAIDDGGTDGADAAIDDEDAAVDDDARPSDDPTGWMDPPVATTSDPCCDVGPIIDLDDVTRQASPPAVAWNGTAWGVVWGEGPNPFTSDDPERIDFVSLDERAMPLAPRTTLAVHGPPSSLWWSGARFGLVTAGPFVHAARQTSHVSLLGMNGELERSADLPDLGLAITRFPIARGWAIASNDTVSVGDDSSFPALLRIVDDALATATTRDLGLTTHEEGGGLALLELKSRLVAIVETRDGAVAHAFAGRDVAETWTTTFTDPPHTLERGGAIAQAFLVATALRDTVIVVRDDGGDLGSAVLDPFARALVSTAPAFARANFVEGMAGDDRGGTAGLCVGLGDPSSGETTSFQFTLLGTDGRPIGAPVTVMTALHHAESCAVGVASADHYVVVLWDPVADGVHHNLHAATVTVRR